MEEMGSTHTGLKRVREKYRGTPLKRPAFLDEQSWTIFTAYVYEERSLRQMRDWARMPLSRLRQILHEVDEQLELSQSNQGAAPESAIEELGLSIRARNTLQRAGCRTVGDVLKLDLSKPVLRIGGKTRIEVLLALQVAGFRHPALALRTVSGVTHMNRSLERMQERINEALRSVAKEVSVVQRQLEGWMKE